MQTENIVVGNDSKAPGVIVHGNANGFLQEVTSGTHHFQADEPVDYGGSNTAPSPYDFLVAALGACTAMTIGWYARKKKIPLQDIKVSLWQSRIHAKDCSECMTKKGMIHRIDLEIELTGQLTPQQRSILMEAAAKCPVHRTLTSEINIRLREAGKSAAT